MYIRLVEFFEPTNLYDNEHLGFRGCKLVIIAGIDFVNAIVDAIDGGDRL